MNKTLQHFIAIFLCFCMICSLCGVGFAAVENVPDAADPERPTAGSSDGLAGEGTDVSLATPPPAPEPDPDPEPPAPDPEPEVPTPDPEPPAPDLDPVEPSPAPDDVDPDPDASPAPEPDPPASAAPAGPSVAAPAPDIDVTYVALPEDYVIKSSSLEGMYAIDPQSALAPVTPSNTSGLKSVLLSILGNYDPIVAEYQYVGSGSYNNYIREIQPDYVWLTSAAIFAILLYCTWRILGGLVCRK